MCLSVFSVISRTFYVIICASVISLTLYGIVSVAVSSKFCVISVVISLMILLLLITTFLTKP